MTKILVLCLSFLPQMAEACSVCFGKGNSDLQKGFYWGILLLILLPPILFLAIGGKIFLSVYKNRRLKVETK